MVKKPDVATSHAQASARIEIKKENGEKGTGWFEPII